MAEEAATAARRSRPPVIVDVGLDVNDLASMKAFWEATLGYHEARGKDSYSYLVDPSGHGPHLFLQVVPERRTEKNRLHLDIVVDGESFRLASLYRGSDRPDSDPPDLRLELPAWVLIDLRLGTLTLDDALSKGLISKRGKARALRNFRRIFQLD